MVEYGAAQVGDHPLADAHHEIEARPGRGGEQHHPRDHRREGLVEEPRLTAAEAAIDDILQAAAEGQDAARGHQEGERRDGNPPAVGPQEARQSGEARELHRPKKRTWLRPSSFARYIAASALRSRASPSPPSAGNSDTPMLAARRKRRLPTRNSAASACCSFSAITRQDRKSVV